MITRQDYLKNSGMDNHRKYYAQFVNQDVKNAVMEKFGIDKLRESYRKDEHFNTKLTPMKDWDLLGGWVWQVRRGEEVAVMQPHTDMDILPVDYRLLRDAGEGVSSATMVCISKEAARQIVEEL